MQHTVNITLLQDFKQASRKFAVAYVHTGARRRSNPQDLARSAANVILLNIVTHAAAVFGEVLDFYNFSR